VSASPIFAAARDQWAAMSRDFADYREAQIATALADTNGVLTNALGSVTGRSAEDLFSGPRAVAQRFASPELIEWWDTHGRMTITEYEAQWFASVGQVA